MHEVLTNGRIIDHGDTRVDPAFELAMMQYRSLLQEAKGLEEQRAAKIMLAKHIAKAYNLVVKS